jgi:N4-gp56 family major capsid protein
MSELFKLNLHLFAANTNVTTDTGLSDEMKTFYSDYLIDMAEPLLVHDQFGQKQPIPKNGGKTIEFRKYSPLAKALTPLTEGVTPNGQKLNMSVIPATVAQYGGYVTLSDVLLLTAIDNNLLQATELLASQAGRTLDTVTREVLQGGTNVMYAQG